MSMAQPHRRQSLMYSTMQPRLQLWTHVLNYATSTTVVYIRSELQWHIWCWQSWHKELEWARWPLWLQLLLVVRSFFCDFFYLGQEANLDRILAWNQVTSNTSLINLYWDEVNKCDDLDFHVLHKIIVFNKNIEYILAKNVSFYWKSTRQKSKPFAKSFGNKRPKNSFVLIVDLSSYSPVLFWNIRSEKIFISLPIKNLCFSF